MCGPLTWRFLLCAVFSATLFCFGRLLSVCHTRFLCICAHYLLKRRKDVFISSSISPQWLLGIGHCKDLYRQIPLAACCSLFSSPDTWNIFCAHMLYDALF